MLVLDRLIGLASPEAALRRAVRLSEQGKVSEAFPLLTRSAKAGIADAEYRVACCYLEGAGDRRGALAASRRRPRARRGANFARRAVRARSRRWCERRSTRTPVCRKGAGRAGFRLRRQMGAAGGRSRLRQGSGGARLCADL